MSNVASYKNETKLVTDKKVNLIFGLNGTGKSTFANYLYEPTAPEFSNCNWSPTKSDSILVYSQKFIQDNFFVADRLKGIFSLSKENKEAEEKIVAAQDKLQTLKQQREKKVDEKQKVSQKLEKQRQLAIDEVWKIKTKYSGGDRVLEYCLKGFMGQKDKLFYRLIEIEKPSDEPTKTIKQLKEEVDNLKGDSAQPQLSLSLINFNAHDVEKHELFSKPVIGNDNSIVAGLIDALGNSDWVNKGLQYLPNGEILEAQQCPFCQRPTITQEIAESIRSYFDGAYQSDIDQLKNFESRYKIAYADVEKLSSFTNHPFAKDRIKDLSQRYQVFIECLKRNLSIINAKIQAPGTAQTLKHSDNYLAEFNDVITAINDDILEYNMRLNHREQALNAIKEEFWSLMSWQYGATITRYKKDLASSNSALKRLDNEIQQIDLEIFDEENRLKTAQKETVNIDEAISAVNSGLLELGIEDFRIKKHSEVLYRVVRGTQNEHAFNTLSEGEKMMISFLYFCELCKGRQSSDDTEMKKIILIDDPISSLSHIFIFNVGRLIRKVFFDSERFSQVFILTHSLYFFYELTETKHDIRKERQKLFRMTKSSSGSKIIEMKYEEIQNDYQAYWSVINDQDQQPALIANCMRNIIEYFFNFVKKRDFNNVFQSPELQEIKFQAFSRYVNRESHSLGQNIIDLKEYDYDIFKEGLRLVFEKLGYSEHFKEMSKI